MIMAAAALTVLAAGPAAASYVRVIDPTRTTGGVVSRLTIDGVAHDRPWTTFADLRSGGVLRYTLSASRDQRWGSDPAAAPASYPAAGSAEACS